MESQLKSEIYVNPKGELCFSSFVTIDGVIGDARCTFLYFSLKRTNR